MSGRFYVTGVQIGMLIAFAKTHQPKNAIKLLEEIIDKQFLGHAEELKLGDCLKVKGVKRK